MHDDLVAAVLAITELPLTQDEKVSILRQLFDSVSQRGATTRHDLRNRSAGCTSSLYTTMKRKSK